MSLDQAKVIVKVGVADASVCRENRLTHWRLVQVLTLVVNLKNILFPQVRQTAQVSFVINVINVRNKWGKVQYKVVTVLSYKDVVYFIMLKLLIGHHNETAGLSTKTHNI